MKLVKTEQYSRVEKRFFKKRMELLPKYAKVLLKIIDDEAVLINIGSHDDVY
jgi:hypothetical protein